MIFERKREEGPKTEGENHCVGFDVEGEKIREVRGAESVGRELPTDKTVQTFCLRFAETALQLVTERAENEAKQMTQLVSGANFEAGELRRNVKVVDYSERLFKDSRVKALPAKGSAKEIVKTESGSSVSGAVLHKEKFWHL